MPEKEKNLIHIGTYPYPLYEGGVYIKGGVGKGGYTLTSHSIWTNLWAAKRRTRTRTL